MDILHIIRQGETDIIFSNIFEKHKVDFPKKKKSFPKTIWAFSKTRDANFY